MADFPFDSEASTEYAAEGARGMVWLLDNRGIDDPAQIERQFHSSWETASGDESKRSWEVFSEIALKQGMRPSVLDCSPAQAVKLVEEGADVAAFHPGHGWLIVHGCYGRGGKFETWRSRGSEKTIRWRKKLLKMFEQIAIDQRIRLVAVDRRNIDLETDPLHRKPFDRLKQILKPEVSDIYVVVVFAFVVGLLMLASPIAVETLVNTVAFGRYLQPIIVLSIILLTFLTFSAAITALQTYVVEIIQQRLFARVGADLACRLPRVSTEQTDKVHMQELINRFFDVMTVQKVCASLLLDGVSLVLTVFIGMAVLGFYHPFLLGFDLFLLVSIAVIVFVLGRGAINTAIKESKTKYNMASWLEDVGRCGSVFRAPAGKRLAAGRADRLIHDYLTARKKHFRILLRQILFALGLQAIASTVLLGVGGWLVISGELTLGQLVAAELIVAVIVGAFAKLGKHLESFYDMMASLDKLGNLFDLPPERRGGVLIPAEENAAAIVMTDVTYRSASSRRALPSPVSVRVEPGKSMAIVGGAGSGKSTLLELIYGYRRPTGGTLWVDGRPPTDIQADDFRRWSAMVRPGETFVGSVAENVHLNRVDVSTDEIIEALATVGLLATVRRLPDGLDTMLNGVGAPLSEGENRLLLLARAIAGRPRLMLIDGLLDTFSDDEAIQLVDTLKSDVSNCTLVISTGRSLVAARLANTIELSAPTLTA